MGFVENLLKYCIYMHQNYYQNFLAAIAIFFASRGVSAQAKLPGLVYRISVEKIATIETFSCKT